MARRGKRRARSKGATDPGRPYDPPAAGDGEEQAVLAALPHIRPDGAAVARKLPAPPASESERMARSPLAHKLHGPRRPAGGPARRGGAAHRPRPRHADPLPRSDDDESPTSPARRRRPRGRSPAKRSPSPKRAPPPLSSSTTDLVALALGHDTPRSSSSSDAEGFDGDEAEEEEVQQQDQGQGQSQDQDQDPDPDTDAAQVLEPTPHSPTTPTSSPGGKKKKKPGYSLDKLRAEDAEARLASVSAERDELQRQLDAITHQLRANNADEADIKGRLSTIQAALNRAKADSKQVSGRLEAKFKERLAAKTAAHEAELVRLREDHSAEVAQMRARIAQLQAAVAAGGGSPVPSAPSSMTEEEAVIAAAAAAANESTPKEKEIVHVIDPGQAEELSAARVRLSELRAELAHERERSAALAEVNTRLEDDLAAARDRLAQSESGLDNRETNAELHARMRALESQLSKTRKLEDAASSLEQERQSREQALRSQLEQRAEDVARAELEHDVQSKIIRHLQDRLSEATSARQDALALVQANEMAFERQKNALADEWSERLGDCEGQLAKARSDKAMLNKLVQQLEDRLAVAQAHAVVSRPGTTTTTTTTTVPEEQGQDDDDDAERRRHQQQMQATSTVPQLQMLVERMEREIRQKDGELRRLQLENAEIVSQLAGERDGAMSDLTEHVTLSRTKASQYEGELHALRAQVAALSEEKALLTAAAASDAPVGLREQARSAAGVAPESGGVPTAAQDAVLAAVHAATARERERFATALRELADDLATYRSEMATAIADARAGTPPPEGLDVAEVRTELAGLQAELVVLRSQLEAAHADRSALAERARTLTQRLSSSSEAGPASGGATASTSAVQEERRRSHAAADLAASSALSRQVRDQLAQEHASKNKEAILERLRRSQGEASAARQRAGPPTAVIESFEADGGGAEVPLDRHLRDEQVGLHIGALGQQLLSRTLAVPLFKVVKGGLRPVPAKKRELSVTVTYGMGQFTFDATDHVPAQSAQARADAAVAVSAVVSDEQARALVRQSLLRQRTKARLCGVEGAEDREWAAAVADFLMGLVFLRDDQDCVTLVVQHAPKARRRERPLHSGGRTVGGAHVMVTVYGEPAGAMRVEVYNPETLEKQTLTAAGVGSGRAVAERVFEGLGVGEGGELEVVVESSAPGSAGGSSAAGSAAGSAAASELGEEDAGGDAAGEGEGEGDGDD